MPDIRHLRWDDWNVGHIARHQVTTEEAEEVWHNDYIVREAYMGRVMLIGPTNTGRVLAVVLDPEPEEGVYYPVTARPASRRERRQYHHEKGDEPL
jgi:uncharacterized DUF497 family protein